MSSALLLDPPILFLAHWMQSAFAAGSLFAALAYLLPARRADVPFYPPAAWSARLGGTVDIEVIVEDGKVINAEVKRGEVEGATGKVKTEISSVAGEC